MSNKIKSGKFKDGARSFLEDNEHFVWSFRMCLLAGALTVGISILLDL